MPWVKNVVVLSLVVIAAVGVIGGICNRIKTSKGIGLRFIQYLGLTVLVPIIVLLSLEDRISQEMTGAIFAAAVGGVLAGIGKNNRDD